MSKFSNLLKDILSGVIRRWEILEDSLHLAFLHPFPSTPGETVIVPKSLPQGNIFNIPEKEFLDLMLVTRNVALKLEKSLQVMRCALIAEVLDHQYVHTRVLPMHGLGQEWQSIVSEDLEYSDTYKGYTSTKDGPKASDETLNALKTSILQCQPPFTEDHTFHGDPHDDNLFSKVVRGELPQWRIWQSEEHIAVLTPFPNTPGFTVLLPRKRLSSNIPALEEQDYVSMMSAARKVGQLLQKAFETPNIAMVCEGMAIDYAHVKLIPLHASRPEDVAKLHVEREHVEKYRGYITSKEGMQANEEDLKSLQKRIVLEEEELNM